MTLYLTILSCVYPALLYIIFILSSNAYNKILGSNKRFPLWKTGCFIYAQSAKASERHWFELGLYPLLFTSTIHF